MSFSDLLTAAPVGAAGKVFRGSAPCFPYTYIVAQAKDYKQAVGLDSSREFQRAGDSGHKKVPPSHHEQGGNQQIR